MHPNWININRFVRDSRHGVKTDFLMTLLGNA